MSFHSRTEEKNPDDQDRRDIGQHPSRQERSRCRTLVMDVAGQRPDAEFMLRAASAAV
jgi:hypothetical protein